MNRREDGKASAGRQYSLGARIPTHLYPKEQNRRPHRDRAHGYVAHLRKVEKMGSDMVEPVLEQQALSVSSLSPPPRATVLKPGAACFWKFATLIEFLQ
jgi:hypothetical protein